MRSISSKKPLYAQFGTIFFIFIPDDSYQIKAPSQNSMSLSQVVMENHFINHKWPQKIPIKKNEFSFTQPKRNSKNHSKKTKEKKKSPSYYDVANIRIDVKQKCKTQGDNANAMPLGELVPKMYLKRQPLVQIALDSSTLSAFIFLRKWTNGI